MYPILRLAREMFRARRLPALPIDGLHETRMLCWPVDLDFQMEMNNGRVLTLYDLGRIPMALRCGLLGAMRANGWGFAMAGASVRYRRRVTAFARIRMTTRCLGRDARFFYIEQTMWVKGEAASNILYRAAVTGRGGIVPTDTVLAALGRPEWNPDMPGWVTAWIAAEGERPWPPAA